MSNFFSVKRLSHRAVVCLALALFLVAPSAFCWECCCAGEAVAGHANAVRVVDSAADATPAGHGCCSKAASAPDQPTVQKSGCDCDPFTARAHDIATAVVQAGHADHERAAAAAILPRAVDAPRSVSFDRIAGAHTPRVTPHRPAGPTAPRGPPALLS